MDHYYMKLRKRYPHSMEGDEIEITMGELTELFHCTGRNVNLVLRRMEESGWIRWFPGRGRGHRSRLVFLAQSEAVVLESAQAFVERGDIQQAFAYLDEHSYLPSIKDQFVYWLDMHFGFSPEMKNEQKTDTLRLPFSKPIETLDPAFITYVVECHMVQQIFEVLVKYNEKTDMIEGNLAHYWTSSNKETEWTFYLRKGVYFHHGKEMTSSDVKFTLERIKNEEQGSPFHWLFTDVGRIEILDKYALRIVLNKANPLFLHHLSLDRASIVPADAVQEMGSRFRRMPVGTGPFKVVRNDDSMLVLEAFPRYFDRRAHLDRIEIWFTPELERKASHLSAPSYQMHYQCHIDGEVPNDWQAIETIGRDCSFVTFNMDLPGPQQNVYFRKAFLHGLDRKQLNVSGMGEVSLAKWFHELSREHSDTDDQYDPMTARQCLARSGYKGETLLLTYSSNFRNIAESIREQLSELGIRMELRQMDSTKNVEHRMRQIHQSHFCLCRNVVEQDLELSVIELFLAASCHVRAHLGTEMQQQTDWLIRRLYQEGSSVIRGTYLNRLRSLVTEQVYVLFLFQHTQRTVFHPSLKNVSLNAIGWVQFRELWFEPTTGQTANAAGAE
ncbi:HTH-type transcriptional regulator SgrR [Paenibacillus solanacearum]|uniref:HTH-type transcriptional regulator SgrR n=1 Tax=Paenibacillus solanacearum TaxID=2048548 RepID=A0A916K4S2_9BACL|nr:ABC transporter substrate-binding protein [Paenibacillus solanacearum]CAG7625029.1 HTH-type transcriptional regulator SgrR [Paenibacillus solanacearum]